MSEQTETVEQAPIAPVAPSSPSLIPGTLEVERDRLLGACEFLLAALGRYGMQIDDVFGHDERLGCALQACREAVNLARKGRRLVADIDDMPDELHDPEPLPPPSLIPGTLEVRPEGATAVPWQVMPSVNERDTSATIADAAGLSIAVFVGPQARANAELCVSAVGKHAELVSLLRELTDAFKFAVEVGTADLPDFNAEDHRLVRRARALLAERKIPVA